jgi:hypothetical protein
MDAKNADRNRHGKDQQESRLTMKMLAVLGTLLLGFMMPLTGQTQELFSTPEQPAYDVALSQAYPGSMPGSMPASTVMEELSATEILTTEGAPVLPSISTPFVAPECRLAGCQQEECVEASTPDTSLICTMEYRYTCYRTVPSRCERQANGQCGWSMTPELENCLAKITSATTPLSEAAPQ